MSETLPPRTITEPVTLTVNGLEIAAQKGELLIEACERGGTYIPRFCYHPRMDPVGMCRMCLVEVDTGRGPALQPSCMIECSDGMTVNTESDKVVKAQDGVLEFLLINHPLDCPVCDKGGECPLQDQTMAYGPGESRWVEEKRHFVKPIPISETIYLDRERCILCDRCTRFASDVAGDALIHFMGRGAFTEINTFPDEPFASYFSGNTVQICPVGALTAKPFRFKARPWDLAEVESTCTTCSVGCRVAVESSRDEVLRYQGVDSDPVNWGWLCDKGRFGFEAVNSTERLTEPLMRSGSELVPTRWSAALESVANSIRAAVGASGAGAVAVLGGAHLTNEAAYAWAKLAKSVIGTDHVDAQLGDGLPAQLLAALAPATINEVCRPGGTVIYLGPDPKEALPVLHLRLRHAVVKDGVTIIEISPTRTNLSQLAAATLTYRPGEVAATVRSLFDAAGAVTAEGSSAEDASLARARAALAAADGAVTVVVGRPTVTEPAGYIVDAVSELAARLDGVTFLPVLRRANVRGALDGGLAPGMLPGRVSRADGAEWFAAAWGSVPAADGLDATGILRAAADGKIETLVLLGADPLSDYPDHNLAERALAGARTVVAVDQFLNASSARAHVVLAAAGFAEVAGTTTNIEGRVTAINQKVTPPGTARSDLELAAELAHRLGADLGLADPAAVRAELAMLSPLHAGWTDDVLSADRCVDGIVLPIPTVAEIPQVEITEPEIPEVSLPETEMAEDERDANAEDEVSVVPPGPTMPVMVSDLPDGIGSLPANDSYSLRLVAVRALYDQGTVVQQMRSSSGLATDAVASLHSAEAAKLGLANGDLVRVIGNDTSLVVPARIDDGVPRGSVAVGWQRANAPLTRLIDSTAPVCDVRIEVSLVNALAAMLATDPILDHVDGGVILVVILKVVLAFVALLVAVMLMIWFERKVHADMSNRLGPNRAGPFGILQTLADGIKFFFKEDLIPDAADRTVFKLAPYLSLVPAFLVFAVVPLGGRFDGGRGGVITLPTWLGGRQTLLQVADPQIGILFVLALSSVAVYGIMLAGWSSGSKYPLLGSVRASAQMVSYEAAIGLSLLPVLLESGSLSTNLIANSQHHWHWNLWMTGLVPFVIFFIAATAEMNRPPFDLVEAEQELVGGFHTEYSSIRFALYFLAEFMNVITMSAIITTLFLGGPDGPSFGPDWLRALTPTVWFLVKVVACCFTFVLFRTTLPRLRYDQLMDLGWKLLIPLALGWFLLLVAVHIGDDQGWNVPAVIAVSVVVLAVASAMLKKSIRTSAARRVLEEVR